jgi:hypothetical protein
VGGNATFPFEGLLLKSADRQFFPSAWTRGGSLLTEFTYYAAKAGKIEATMSGDGIAQPTRFEMPTKPGTNRVVLRVSSDSDVQTAQVSSTFAIRPEDTGGSPQPGDVYVEGSDQPSPPDHVKVVKGEHKEPGVVAGMHNYSFLLVLGILAADVLLFRRKLAPHGWVALIAHLHEANVFTATIGRILGALFPAIVAVVASIDPFAMLWGTARGAALRVIALTLIAVIFLLRKIIILLWKPASDSEVNAEESHRKVLFLYLFFCLFCAGGAVWSWYEGGLLRENAPLIRGTVVTDATTAGGPHSAESAQ